MKTIAALRILAANQTNEEQIEKIVIYSLRLKRDIIEGRMDDLNESVARLSLQIMLRMISEGKNYGDVKTMDVKPTLPTLDLMVQQLDEKKLKQGPDKMNTTLIMMTYDGWLTRIVYQNGMLRGVRKEVKSQIIAALK